MAALQSRAFAQGGWTTLQFDLYGCGDSDGDFSEVHWQHWLADVADASSWLQARTARPPVLWGLRAGCLLAVQAASRMARADLVLWQPVLSGKHYLQQLLRLKGASELVARSDQPATAVQDARAKLERGETIEVVGYPLTSALAYGMEAAELDLPPGTSSVAWLEIRSKGNELSPASQVRVDALRAHGHAVSSRVVHGPAFWQIAEAEDCMALIDSTLGAAAASPP
jgi:uncharacterized protein